MAGDVGFSNGRRAVSALLFMQAGMYSLDAMSTLNSSPWTSENFGADPVRAKTAREYVWHAIGVGSGYCVLSAIVAGPDYFIWPILGAFANGVYLYWIYDRALKRAQQTGNTDWTTP